MCQKSDIFAQHSGPVMIMKWCDKKNVSMVSIYLDSHTKVEFMRRKGIKKPHCVIDYNTNKGTLTYKPASQQVPSTEEEGVPNCYIKLFKRLLYAAVLNSLLKSRMQGITVNS